MILTGRISSANLRAFRNYRQRNFFNRWKLNGLLLQPLASPSGLSHCNLWWIAMV